MIAPLAERRTTKGMETQKLRVLEAGPGTGSVTIHILKQLGPDDDLVICEINARFLDALKKTLSTNEDFKKHESRVRFYNCAIQDLPEHEGKFDAIICAIPFLNLDRGVVEAIFSKFKDVSHDRTSMTYYEYMGLRSLGKVISSSQRRERLKNIDSFFKALLPAHLVSRTDVYMNLLPTHVYRLTKLDRLQVDSHSVH
jgi:phospholipid N-methyltransferase